jgi:UDP-glucose 4-epimerase
MLLAVEKSRESMNIFNLGTDEYCTVDDSLSWICEYLRLSPGRRYTGGERGWIGDNPFIFLDAGKARSLGWRPALGIREGILCTLRFLQDHPWVLERRH